MVRAKLVKYTHKVIELSIYLAVFFMPISKALLETFVSLAIFSWILNKIARKIKLAQFFPSTYLNLPILLYLSACVFSFFFSTNSAISFRHLYSKIAEYLLFFFILVETVDRRILKNLLILLIFSAGLLGVDGIFQYFSGWDFLRLRKPPVATRITGPFDMANDFATYVVSLLPLVASATFLKFKKAWVKIAIILLSFLLVVCLVLSASRSVWLALVLAIPFMLILRHRKLTLLVLLVIIVILSFFPFLSEVTRERVIKFLRLDFSDLAGSAHREFLWQMALKMFEERPLFGQGLGTFMYNFERFQPEDYPVNWGICYAHNCFLQMAAETGIWGLLAFVSIITVLFFMGYKDLMRLRDNLFYYTVLSGLLVGIYMYLVNSFFDTGLYSLPLTVLFWFMVALVVAVDKIIKTQNYQRG